MYQKARASKKMSVNRKLWIENGYPINQLFNTISCDTCNVAMSYHPLPSKCDDLSWFWISWSRKTSRSYKNHSAVFSINNDLTKLYLAEEVESAPFLDPPTVDESTEEEYQLPVLKAKFVPKNPRRSVGACYKTLILICVSIIGKSNRKDPAKNFIGSITKLFSQSIWSPLRLRFRFRAWGAFNPGKIEYSFIRKYTSTLFE